jgi:carboxylesterase
MGAALALHLAANFSLQGVIALAPALRLPLCQQAAVYALSPFMRWKSKPDGPDVRDKTVVSRLQSYERYPTASVKELLHTMRRVREELPKVTAPLLILHGRHDRTMPYANVALLRKRVRSQEISVEFFENSGHLLSVDFDHQAVFAAVLNFVRRHSSEKNLLRLK